MRTSVVLYLHCLLSLLPLALSGEAEDLCCLCPGCKAPLPGRENLFVTKWGHTCNEMFLWMADPSNQSNVHSGMRNCTGSIAKFRPTCCDASTVARPVVQAPTSAPGSNIPQGSHPSCNLCHSGKFPEEPTTMTAILGIPGNPTCRELYYMALKGHIKDQMCKPMQDYMDEPCGCWDRTSKPNGSGGSSSGGGGASHGGAPSQASVGGDNDNLANKKTVPEDDDKDDEKMHDGVDRGGIRRKRILRGSDETQ